jgi:hypothetical protein
MDEISSKSEQEWNTHAVDPSHGTVLIINCAPNIIKELYDSITSNEIINSLVYHLGWTYCKSINKGVKMSIKINGKFYKEINAIDPLEWDNSEDKTRTEIDVYVNNDNQEDVRVYFMNESSQEYGYLDNNKKKCGDFTTGNPPEYFTRVTSMDYRSVYNEPSKWTELQKDAFDHIDYKHPVTKNGKPKKYQGTYKHMGGRYYTRNDKTIYRVPTEKKKDGDKDKYKFHDDSRHELRFNCQADKLISILLNKSKLDETKINKSVIHTMKFLDNIFAKSLAKKYCNNKNDNRDTDDSSSDEEIEIRAPRSVVRSVPQPPVVASNHEEDDDRFADASYVSDSDSGDETEAVEDKLNLEVVNMVLVDKSAVKYDFDQAYDLEHESDLENEIESSGEENDSDSATTRDVGPSEHLRYSAKGGKSDMKKWFESGEHAPELDTLVEELIQKYKTTISQADMKEIFSYMSREKKFEWIMKLITDKYPIDTDDMLKGCEVYRAYHEVFPHE